MHNVMKKVKPMMAIRKLKDSFEGLKSTSQGLNNHFQTMEIMVITVLKRSSPEVHLKIHQVFQQSEIGLTMLVVDAIIENSTKR